MRLRPFLCSAAVIAATATFASAAPVDVDLELVFLNDVSGSIDATDFAFQLAGYEAAFRDASVIQKITEGAIGKIAVSIGFFATSAIDATGWFIIEDAASSNAFADVVAALARPGSIGGSDGTNTALLSAAGWINDNLIESTRQVIDVVTEGAQDINDCVYNSMTCGTLQAARDQVLSGGIDQINAMLLQDRTFFGNNPGDIIDAVLYAETNMIGGTGSFAVFEEDFTGFSSAIKDKIIREVAPPPVPVPAAAWFLLAGIGALAAARRRQA